MSFREPNAAQSAVYLEGARTKVVVPCSGITPSVVRDYCYKFCMGGHQRVCFFRLNSISTHLHPKQPVPVQMPPRVASCWRAVR